MEGWFDLRESNNVIDSEAKEKSPGNHFMDAKNTADYIKCLVLIFRTLVIK